jgi:ubiquinone/menaquinone biosynthesis C-methylase UbiE
VVGARRIRLWESVPAQASELSNRSFVRLLVLVLLFVVGCSHKQHHSPHAHGDANQHMHKTEHAELIKRFDDPTRDEWQRPEKVLELMGPLSGKTLIDIGVGSGYFTSYFLKAKANVVAGDVDAKFLDHIKTKFPAKDYPKLTLSKIAYDNPNMKANSFDYAFTSNTYHHIENRVEYLKKVKTGLKVGGHFVVVDFKPNPKTQKRVGPPLEMRVPVTTVVQELLEAGFDHLRIYDLELEHQYVVIGSRTF